MRQTALVVVPLHLFFHLAQHKVDLFEGIFSFFPFPELFVGFV